MEISISEEVQTGALAFLVSNGPWVMLLALFICMLPKIIPALSAAVAEQRKISHKRQDNLRKIQNNAQQRAVPQSRPAVRGTRRQP